MKNRQETQVFNPEMIKGRRVKPPRELCDPMIVDRDLMSGDGDYLNEIDMENCNCAHRMCCREILHCLRVNDKSKALELLQIIKGK